MHQNDYFDCVVTESEDLDTSSWVPDRVVEKNRWYRFDDDGFLFESNEGEKGAWRAGRSGVVEGKTADEAFIVTPCTCGADKVKDPFHYEWCDKYEADSVGRF